MQFGLLAENTIQDNYFLHHHLHLPLTLNLLIHLQQPLPLNLVYFLLSFQHYLPLYSIYSLHSFLKIIKLLQDVYHSVNLLNLNFVQPPVKLPVPLFIPHSPLQALLIPQPTLHFPHFLRLLPLSILLQLLFHTPVILVIRLLIPKLQAQWPIDLRDKYFR